MNIRLRLYLTGILLMFSLFCAVVAARATVSAFQSFQQENTRMNQGDVQTIRPWMTIPYIAHVYNVPENYLYDGLHVSNARALHHVTLQVLATHSHAPVEKVIRTVQDVIVTYRRQHRASLRMLSASVSHAYWHAAGRTTT